MRKYCRPLSPSPFLVLRSLCSCSLSESRSGCCQGRPRSEDCRWCRKLCHCPSPSRPLRRCLQLRFYRPPRLHHLQERYPNSRLHSLWPHTNLLELRSGRRYCAGAGRQMPNMQEKFPVHSSNIRRVNAPGCAMRSTGCDSMYSRCKHWDVTAVGCSTHRFKRLGCFEVVARPRNPAELPLHVQRDTAAHTHKRTRTHMLTRTGSPAVIPSCCFSAST